MVNALMQRFQVPGGIDFSPVSNAISENRLMQFRQKEADRANEIQQAQLGMQGEQMAMRRQEFDSRQDAQMRQQYAGIAQMALSDPQNGAAIWQTRVASDPRWQKAFAENGLADMPWQKQAEMLIAEARGYQDPMKAKESDLQIKLLEGKIAELGRTDPVAAEMQAEKLRQLKQKNEQDALINSLIGGVGAAPAPQQQGAQPQLYKQSMEGPAGPQDPNLVLTAGATAPQQGPQAPPQQDMVQTPMGAMPAEQARRLGFGLAMGGRGDAGRMFFDAANSQKLGEAASNENEKQLFNSVNALSRLDEITALADPKFLTVGNQLKNWGAAWVDRLAPDKLTPEARQELANYTRFGRSAIDNLNRYIKEITGAQMSEAEAGRLRRAVPDPDNDSPTQFMAKLQDAKNTTRLAIIRYSYLRKNGFSGTAEAAEAQIPLSKMSAIVDQTMERAMQQINQQMPRASMPEKQNAARQIMKRELGVEI